jgi:hypothetical protein
VANQLPHGRQKKSVEHNRISDNSRRFVVLHRFQDKFVEHQLTIDLLDCSSADANRYAQDLETALIRLSQSIEVKRGTKPGSQEIVSSLVLLFGTPVAVSLAHSIYTFLKRNSGAKIRITTRDGLVLADHLDSSDAARIAEAFAALDKAK